MGLGLMEPFEQEEEVDDEEQEEEEGNDDADVSYGEE